MTQQVGSTETQKALDMNGKLGLLATWAKRFGVITRGSLSVDDIKNTSMIQRQGGIIAGLNVGITTESIEGLFEAESSKTWSKEEIKDLLMKNDKAVYRALKVIYSLQTEDEKKVEHTKEVNNVGFSGYDSQFLSSLAKQYEQRGTLSPKQLQAARKGLMKYAGQLAKVANKQIAVKV